MNFRKVLHGAFAFAEDRGYCESNPVTKTTRIKIDRGPPTVLSSDQMRVLMAKAPEEIIPYLAISGFAGLRISEINRLDWSCVDLARARIEVKVGSKTGHRWVDAMPNLVAWLAPYKRTSGPVAPKKASTIRKDAAKAAGITSWENNCLRHSFGSAHAVKFGDPVRTSSQMGNTPRILLEHYRRLITPEEASEWFGVLPPDRGNVITLGAQTA
jgi:integrase